MPVTHSSVLPELQARLNMGSRDKPGYDVPIPSNPNKL
jgi:hypothetical protein